LDLLLQLIEQEELNITEIALSQITEQYLAYLDKLEKNRSEKLADFLIIAAKLVYLKSKNLCGFLYPEEDEGVSLADQLKMYKAYVEASKNVNNLWLENRVAYGRLEPPIKLKEFVAPSNASLENLVISFQLILKRLRPISPLPQVTVDHSISVKQTIDKIRDLISIKKQFNFSHLISNNGSRTEIIVSFLALLELLKNKVVSIQQNTSYGELEIARV
jgi:segregation and condensation protein A